MKCLTKIIVFCVVAAELAGCGKTITVIQSDSTVTNTVSMRAFQDEQYIWETWQYGTNRSDAVIK